MLHLICTVHVGQVGRVPEFLDHYLAVGVERVWLTLHAPRPGDEERASDEAAAIRAELKPGRLGEVGVQTGAYDPVRIQCNHQRIQEAAVAPHDWIVWADVDELQVHPGTLREVLAEAEAEGANALSGEFVDRVARDGSLAELSDGRPIWGQYPLGCSLTADVLQGYSHKVAVARGTLRVIAGQHEVSRGSPESLRWSRTLVAVHHFKWDATAETRLAERLADDWRARCFWWRESERFLTHHAEHGRIDLSALDVHDFGDGRHRPDDAAAWAFVRRLRGRNTGWRRSRGVASLDVPRFAALPDATYPPDPAERALLARCLRFRTLDVHADRVLRSLGADPAHRRPLRAVLARLASTGYLVQEAEVVRRVGEHRGSDEGGARVSALGFVTRDRPVALARAVESYAVHAEEHGRRPRVVVLDDGSDGSARDALERIRSRLPGDVAYAGTAEKEGFRRRLARQSGVPDDVVDFALADPLGTGESYGANRNALLLEVAGDAVLSADDDTLCLPLLPPGRSEELVLASGRPPVDYWFYADLESSRAELAEGRRGVIDEVESLLGRDVTALLAEAQRGVDLARLDAEGLRRLTGSAGRVVAVVPGMLGDPGGDSPVPGVLFARGDFHRRMVATEDAYRTAVTSRVHLRAVRSPTLDRGGFFMATAFALDARALLPPFLPVCRCEDNLYGPTLRQCRPRDWVGHLPLALVHTPVEAREYSPVATEDPRLLTSLAGLVGRLFAEVAGPGSDEAEALVAMGTHLRELAHASGLESHLRALEKKDLEERVKYVRRCQAVYADSAGWWHRDMDAHVSALRRCLGVGPGLPPEVRSLEDARTVLAAFGDVLAAWPTLWAAAVALRSSGSGLARPL